MFMLSLFLSKMLPPVRGTISRCLSTTFSPLPSMPLPSPREAHVWYIKPEEIDGSFSLKQYMNLLSSHEKRDVLSLNGESLQKNAILARTLVRTTLSRYFDGRVDPRSIKFKKGIYGKPEIMWQDGDSIIKQPLQFSLSHTSSLIACAIALETPIGIDVEENKRKPVNSVMSVARRYFATSEVEYLAAIQNPDIQQKEFIKLWTLKEAYVKATGRGFSGAPFKNFTIQMGSNKRAPKMHIEAGSDCEGLTDNCQFALMELNSSHVVAICMERNRPISDDENDVPSLKVWRTIPFIEDEFISETEDNIGNFYQLLKVSYFTKFGKSTVSMSPYQIPICVDQIATLARLYCSISTEPHQPIPGRYMLHVLNPIAFMIYMKLEAVLIIMPQFVFADIIRRLNLSSL